MIYERWAQFPDATRYFQNHEYMFIISKGKPKTINLIKDRPNRNSKLGGRNRREKDGSFKKINRPNEKVNVNGIRSNIWRYDTGGNKSHSDKLGCMHPASFPEKLVRDHILSWTNEDDIIIDVCNGGGTTTKMAKDYRRNFIGFESEKKYCEIAEKRLELVHSKKVTDWFTNG